MPVLRFLLVALFALLLGALIPVSGVLGQGGQPPLPPPAAPASALPAPDGTTATVSTAFTYQGSLRKQGAPVSKNCSFQFSLWDALAGGAQQGITQIVNNASVEAGSFTVQLDFGSQFTGQARWLETAVQCAGDGGYVTLTPRQPLNAVPYALSLIPGAVVEQPAANRTAIYGKGSGGGSVGLYGESATSTAIYGEGYNGVTGVSSQTGWAATYGEHKGANGFGVYGRAPNGYGTTGESKTSVGVYGKSTSSYGVLGESTSEVGVVGKSQDANGMWGESVNGEGVRGLSHNADHAGIVGVNDGGSYGVYGESTKSYGVVGMTSAASGAGVYGMVTPTGGMGVKGEATGDGKSHAYGIYGVGHGGAIGVEGRSDTSAGVSGRSDQGEGVLGQGSQGVSGYATELNGIGVAGYGGYGPGYAGYFDGRVRVTGTLEKSAGSFLIDHPLDPAHKYLSHSFVESPDMMNIYNGNVTTDGNGEAIVQLPDWFEALNQDFRYQLTPIGQFSQAIVLKEIAGNRFTIKTDKPNVKVSWQVTGIRHDPYAEAHRIEVEQMKTGDEEGKYLHPELYGQPEEKSIRASMLARLRPPARSGNNSASLMQAGGGQ